MKVLALVSLLATVTGPPAPEAEEYGEGRVPMIGLQGPHLDACGGIGRVSGAGTVQPAREGPASNTRVSEKLPRGTMVWLCEAAGEWQGVVYASGEFQEIGDCRVSSPIAVPRSYDGPCKSGWILAKNIELLAG